MARMKAGLDIWECSCKEVNIMGKPCRKCGKSYADILTERAGIDRKPPKKREKKIREPAGKGEFITSFCFKKPKK